MRRLHEKEFEKLIRSMCHRHHLWRVFQDFCEMSALSLSNVLLKDEDREKRYRQIIGAYEKQEVEQFPKLLAITVDALEETHRDFLGQMFMSLELGSHWHGQYFTPDSVCRMMGMIMVDDKAQEIQEKEFITAHDPACGAGAMLIHLAGALKGSGVNYQQRLHVTAIDLDPCAAHMAYIQLSLYNIPAVVHVGNSLSLKITDRFYTMAHHMGLWDYKLARGPKVQEQVVEPTPAAPIMPPTPTQQRLQISLF